MNRNIKTTKKQIVEWGMKNIDEVGYPVDASEMDTRCWRCGYERNTERCHVIPDSLEGEDTPSNYRLLCHDCHLEGPNVNDPNAMDEWIRSTGVGMYDTFWKIREIWKSCWEDITYHWGENFNDSTLEWLSKEFLKRLESNNIDPQWVGIEKIKGCIK
jgi:hypothetical protein